jgi:hypothetical protein
LAIRSVAAGGQARMADRRVSPSLRRLCRPAAELLRQMSGQESVR